MTSEVQRPQLRGGMVGMGMIFDETYRPFFETARVKGMYDRRFGDVDVQLTAVATKTGKRAEAYRSAAGDRIDP
ncbi:MAG: gfo/Idh/MocA family oxidoreductase, partial [Planctomycetaceae bacterium]|nr:gfo/Idh/MocA family oxidoreductase [Planctomycetaceae bacterium]